MEIERQTKKKLRVAARVIFFQVDETLVIKYNSVEFKLHFLLNYKVSKKGVYKFSKKGSKITIDTLGVVIKQALTARFPLGVKDMVVVFNKKSPKNGVKIINVQFTGNY